MNQLHHRGLKATLVAPWTRVAPTRDLPTIAFFPGRRAAATWRTCARHSRNHRPGAIMDKSGCQFAARYSGCR